MRDSISGKLFDWLLNVWKVVTGIFTPACSRDVVQSAECIGWHNADTLQGCHYTDKIQGCHLYIYKELVGHSGGGVTTHSSELGPLTKKCVNKSWWACQVEHNHNLTKRVCLLFGHVSRPIAQLSVGRFGWNFGGWSGRSWVPLPPGGDLIGHQGALLECKRCIFSALCGPIWLIRKRKMSEQCERWAPVCVCGSGQAVEWVNCASEASSISASGASLVELHALRSGARTFS